jgi:hypothetical protein
MNQPDDSFYSTIEDLDPEPRSSHAMPWRRELLLGMALLLGVLGWGGWQWWHQQDTMQNYRLAQEAVARQDWDQALARYTAADGYKDSEARRADAAKQVSERDRQYSLAIDSAKRDDWAAALKAVQTVQRIQPDYMPARSLAQNAESHVYREALEGAIVRRTGATTNGKPGLYYWTTADWVRLEKSDGVSMVRSLGVGGCAVYDVPAPGEPTANTGPSVPGSVDLERRSVMAFLYDGSGTESIPLNFAPQFYDTYFCGKQGVWGLSTAGYLSRAWFDGAEGDYQAYGSAVTATLDLADYDYQVLDLSPDGRHSLLEQLTGGMDHPSRQLYLADGDGGNPRLIYSDNIQITNANFSPDGTYLLLSGVRDYPGMPTYKREILLADIRETKPPTSLLSISEAEGFGHPSGAVFLSRGPFAGKLLIFERGARSNHAKIIDPANPTKSLAESSVPNIPALSVFMIECERESSILLVWEESHTDNTLAVTKLFPAGDAVKVELPMGRQFRLSDLSVSRDHLLYESSRSPENGEERHFVLRSVPLARLGDFDVRTTELHTGTWSESLRSSYMTYSYAGSGLLAMAENRQLHARGYSEDIDLPLEMGVEGFYKDFYTTFHRLR